jgi:hypothetical protein
MEGARRIDEWTRLENKVPGPETVPLLAPVNEREITPVELRRRSGRCWQKSTVTRCPPDRGEPRPVCLRRRKDVYGLVSWGCSK